MKDFIKAYYLPPENITPMNRVFSPEHLIISTCLFICIGFILYCITKRKQLSFTKMILQISAWTMLILELFRITWNGYYHGIKLTMFRFDYCNQVCMVLPFIVIFKQKKLYPYIELLATIGGIFVLIYPLWVFYDYAGFHLLALQSMISHGLMFLIGLILPLSEEKSNLTGLYKKTLIGFGVIVLVAFIMSNVTGANYLIMKSADGLPIIENIPYPWYFLVFYPLALLFLWIFSRIYCELEQHLRKKVRLIHEI